MKRYLRYSYHLHLEHCLILWQSCLLLPSNLLNSMPFSIKHSSTKLMFFNFGIKVSFIYKKKLFPCFLFLALCFEEALCLSWVVSWFHLIFEAQLSWEVASNFHSPLPIFECPSSLTSSRANLLQCSHTYIPSDLVHLW